MKTPNRISSRHLRNERSSLCFIASLVAGLCLTVATGLGSDGAEAKTEVKKQVKEDQKKKADSGEKAVITGSLIPERVKRSRFPTTSSPVAIISQTDIERSGRATLAGVLKKQIPH